MKKLFWQMEEISSNDNKLKFNPLCVFNGKVKVILAGNDESAITRV